MNNSRYSEVVASLLNRNIGVVLFLSFSSGLPLALSASTLQAWMATTSIDIKTIAIFSLAGLPYTLKFIWSPLMDRFIPPFFGRRRGWMLLTQIPLIILIAKMAFTSPEQQIMLVGILAVSIAFLSASQDIAIDAYRTDLLKPKERGFGSAITVMGYRTAMLVSGGLAWVIAEKMGWQFTYCLMAALLLTGVVATLLGPEPELEKKAPVSLQDAVWLPMKEFLLRPHAFLLLLFIVLYKLSDAFSISLTSVFLFRELGFSLTEIGVLYKWLGIVATIMGGFVGGSFIVTHGLYRPLLWFGIFQGVTNLGFMILTLIGKSYTGMIVIVALDQFVGGMGTAVFLAFLMSLCDHRFTATQFAILSALSAIGRVFIGPPAGFLIDTLGWAQFFFVTFLIAIPSLILLIYMRETIESYHLEVQDKP